MTLPGLPDLDAGALAATFAVVLVLVVVSFVVVTTYNDVVGLQLRIDKAWSNIDVVLHQRYNQLPALVDAVHGVLQFERQVLDEVTRQRAGYRADAPVPEQAATAEATTAAVRSLFAVVERYPDLKAQANVLELQASIERLEALLAARRELYNDQVYRYNTRIAQLPGLLLAGPFTWRSHPFFKAPAGAGITPIVEPGL
jgi:LemA protein